MNMNRSIELLCPARNPETAIAAINHGADAIYIGYERFGAREAAGNSLSDIEKIIQYAHIYHSRVYIALNTIIYENELKDIQKLIHTFYNMGSDALIIQDMGILEMDIPKIPLHASTQVHNVSIDKIKFLHDVGFQRVILARELSINDIIQIKENTNIELEAFIHGSLCVSYSGQCYFSQAITGRSANRGECAQPCRSSYDLVDETGKAIQKNKHLLSLKDLNQSDSILDLINAGVSSLKIEGRLKDVSYVKNITAHYRKLIDSIINDNSKIVKASSGKTHFTFTPNPERTFNRGYTSFFSKGRQVGMVSLNTQKSLGKLIGSVTKISESWFSISSNDNIHNNDGLCFINKKGVLNGFKVNSVSDEKVFPNQPVDLFVGAKIFRNYDHEFNQILKQDSSSKRLINSIVNIVICNNEISYEMVDEDQIITKIKYGSIYDRAKDSEKFLTTLQNQIMKTGNTKYDITEVNIKTIDHELPFITIGQINSLRRDLIEKHTINRIQLHKIVAEKIIPNTTPYPEKQLTYKANVSNSLAKKFYHRHGVEKIENAFELQNSYSGKDIMDIKYCIQFELGFCNGKQKKEYAFKQLFLKDKNRKYELKFNCKECKMGIKYQ